MGSRMMTAVRTGPVALALVAVMATASAATVADAAPASGGADVQQAVVRSLSDGVTVQWQVESKTERGWLRLYRGSLSDGLELIAEVPARRGTDVYRHVDRLVVGDGCFYQLRYRGEGGREVVLATAFCREAQAVPAAFTATWSVDPIDTSPLTLPSDVMPVEPVLAGVLLRQLPWTLRPLVPPPEPRSTRARGL